MRGMDPAFPSVEIEGPNEAPTGRFHWHGMSLRDYFAIHADVSEYDFGSVEAAAEYMGMDPPDTGVPNELFEFSFRLVARLKYELADAMLEAREG